MGERKDRRRLDDFLRRQEFPAPEDFVLDRFVTAFHGEMKSGLAGQSGPGGGEPDLAMFPSHIPVEDLRIARDEPVAVIDAGGTNLRTALMTIRDGVLVTENFSKNTMPGVERELSPRDFFRSIAAQALPVCRESRRIGFCFSYPMDQQTSGEGILRAWSKEIKAPGVIGRPVTAGLLEALGDMGLSGERKVAILNDTVAALLAGRTYNPGRNYSSYIGLILGTGLNTSYEEKNANIGKLCPPETRGAQPVNMESAGFSKIPLSLLDRAFIAATENPRVNRMEKVCSGAYLGPLAGFYLRAAAGEGIFSPELAGALKNLEDPETHHLDSFLRNPRLNSSSGDCSLVRTLAAGSQEDLRIVWYLLDILLERASQLAAALLTSVVLWIDCGEDPLRPVCISAEGSTFFKLSGYRFKIEYYLRQFLELRHGRHYELVHVEGASMAGAAVAGLAGET